MTNRFLNMLTAILIGMALFLGGHATIHVDAATTAIPTGPLPASMFQGGSNVIYHKHVGEKGFDCGWALDCNQGGMPVMHSGTGIQMGRTGGWSQIEVWEATIAVQGKHKAYTHTVFEGYRFEVSSFIDAPTPYITSANVGGATGYAGMTAAQAASADFLTGWLNVGVTPVQGGIAGDGAEMEASQGAITMLAAGFWSGTSDVEAIAECAHCNAAQLRDLHATFLTALLALGGQTS